MTTKPTCDASVADALGREYWVGVTGQSSDTDIVRGKKIQMCDFHPVLSAILQGAALQVGLIFPSFTAHLQHEASAGARRAGPLEDQGWLFGDFLTVDGGYWCSICKASTAHREALGCAFLQTLTLGEQ